jgi:hypothetical protein
MTSLLRLAPLSAGLSVWLGSPSGLHPGRSRISLTLPLDGGSEGSSISCIIPADCFDTQFFRVSVQAFYVNDSYYQPTSRVLEHGYACSTTNEAAAQAESGSGLSASTYYLVLTRAISKLPNNTREAREPLYDRAWVALAAKLLQDQLSEAQVAHERLAFEKAIRKLERYARKKNAAITGDDENHLSRLSWLSSFMGFKRS